MDNKTPRVHRSFNRATPVQRKQELIEATLRLISRKGARAATVRAIAEEAKVTQGLIRHHFSSKEELINAAYNFYMYQMNNAISEASRKDGITARERLARFITCSFTSPVGDPETLALWAAFFELAQHETRMRTTHEKSYLHFRDELELLIAEAIDESGGRYKITELRKLAIACNAVIDGLWLEGAALRDRFSVNVIANIGLTTIGTLIGIDLSEFSEEL